MQNKKVFISGGAGVIGTALVQKLLKEKAEIFIGDLKPCPKQWIGHVKYRQGDLNSLTLEELQTFNPEFFFHLAATFERSEESYPFFEENFKHNVKLSHHLMHLFKQVPSLKRVIFASSYLIYDRHLYEFKKAPLHPVLLKENSLTLPRNLCGAAKWLHEQELHFISQFLQEKLSYMAVRIFRVYGRQSRDVISRWIRAALNDEVLNTYQIEGKFDYIFADDVATGLIKLAQIQAKGIVNLGKGQARSVAEVLTILKKFFPFLKTRAEESFSLIEQSQACLSKLKKLTQWQPFYSLETAIPLLIEEEKKLKEEKKQTKKNLIFQKHEAVLITSLSKKMPLIAAVRQAANKIGYFQVLHGCDSDPNCIGQYGVDCFWNCPVMDENFLEKITDYCLKNGITALIPTRNEECLLYATHLDFLQQKGVFPLVSPRETVLICLDKIEFAQFLKSKGYLAIPSSFSIDELEKNCKVHLDRWVVKEQKGAGSQEIGLNLNRLDALKHATHLKSPIFQPYKEGKEWSVDLYRSWNGQINGCVARQRNYVVQGESQVTTTAVYPLLEKMCSKLAEDLNIKGCAIFQVIEDKEGNFHFIECNPRFGGASTASLAVGLDPFFWFFLERVGISLQDYPFLRKQKEIRQVRYLADRVYDFPN